MGFFKSLMSVISTDGKTGTPFKLDKNHTVYYKGNGVTELDAAHVAGFFKGYGFFSRPGDQFPFIGYEFKTIENPLTAQHQAGWFRSIPFYFRKSPCSQQLR
ncbi:MAG: hypothetical protein ABJA78_20600 [Ferruginibacter sp.]